MKKDLINFLKKSFKSQFLRVWLSICMFVYMCVCMGAERGAGGVERGSPTVIWMP